MLVIWVIIYYIFGKWVVYFHVIYSLKFQKKEMKMKEQTINSQEKIKRKLKN